MKHVDVARLTAMSAEAALAPRLRTHHNLHDDLADPVQRVVIALEPGTYVRPHRHAPGVWEMFILLQGACAVLLFDAAGVVIDRVTLSAGESLLAQVPEGAWHSIACLAPGSVALEVKPGPYRPSTDKDFADWAPREGQDGAAGMVRWLEAAQPGECFQPR